MSFKEDYESKNEFIDNGIRGNMSYLNRKLDLVCLKKKVEDIKA